MPCRDFVSALGCMSNAELDALDEPPLASTPV
jgi:hypothetical protein